MSINAALLEAVDVVVDHVGLLLIGRELLRLFELLIDEREEW